MNKKLFFIWSICLLAIVPPLAGCDKENEEGEELIVVERFEGTDGMKGERILFELEDAPAIVLQNDSYEEYALIGLEKTWNYTYRTPSLIGVSKKRLGIDDLPPQTEIRVSLSITNVERNVEANIFPMDHSLDPIRKAYLKAISIRE
ncbi:hypothetical protein [Parabacteroides sp. ZJ-118]|uniref:hypothetical protein n=1 Tax=Parabacteroides sp. ZJ-118 TaxID=2709398 RepID=UPI0013EB1E4F|nr:hypothetical protein [Parabacteroides sp. ZJ-118]